jgi:hypothetical protein
MCPMFEQRLYQKRCMNDDKADGQMFKAVSNREKKVEIIRRYYCPTHSTSLKLRRSIF